VIGRCTGIGGFLIQIPSLLNCKTDKTFSEVSNQRQDTSKKKKDSNFSSFKTQENQLKIKKENSTPPSAYFLYFSFIFSGTKQEIKIKIKIKIKTLVRI